MAYVKLGAAWRTRILLAAGLAVAAGSMAQAADERANCSHITDQRARQGCTERPPEAALRTPLKQQTQSLSRSQPTKVAPQEGAHNP